MRRLKIIAILVASFCLPAGVMSQTLSGRLTSSFYSFERSDTSNVTSTHARGFQGFQLDYRSKNILLRSYGQFDGDFNTQLAGDGKVRLYNLFLQYNSPDRRLLVKLGRQPVFGGFTFGTVDGVQLRAKLTNWLRLKAFGGGLMPSDQRIKLIDDVENNHLLGGQATLQPRTDLRLRLSFMDKKRSRAGYTALRSDSVGNVFTQEINPTDQAYRLGTLDLSWQNQKTSIYARSDLDLYANKLSRAEVSVHSEVSAALTLSGAYTFRSPRLPWNSIFSVFDVENNHEIEGGFYYHRTPSLAVYFNAAGILYEEDSSLRGTLGFEANHLNLSYVHRSGYAGVLDGLNGAFSYPLRDGKLLPQVQLSWASYKVDENAAERETLLASAIGLLMRPHKFMTIDAHVQFLRNRFYSNDMRVLLRYQYWFFTNLKKQNQAQNNE